MELNIGLDLSGDQDQIQEQDVSLEQQLEVSHGTLLRTFTDHNDKEWKVIGHFK